jgi:N-methylhydantoinase A
MSDQIRLAADIGGTFTDVAAFDVAAGKLLWGKTLSTPQQLVNGISEGVAKAGASFHDANLFLHGTTVAINTMLERTGAKTALLITEGFRDVYEIGRVNRPDAYNLYFKKHRPLVERALRFEVSERMYAEGVARKPLDEAEIRAYAKQFKEMGLEAVAVLLLHSYRNPAHELRIKQILEQEAPGLFVSVSHELSQEYREFERCSTVVANAYIGPRVKRYLGEIESHLAQEKFNGSFLVVQSTGGLYESEEAKSGCIRMLESGPAAGVIGTQALTAAMGIKDAISFDMGGTTAKSGVIYNGHPLTTGSALIGGYDQALPIQISMMDIFEVGTGGGSIARAGEGGALRVGPESSGAEPGPVCYGRGGKEPTITDVNLILGRLAADRFLGGEMKLDVKSAERALTERVAKPLGLSMVEAADGILRIAATAMSYAVKGVTTERGLDAAAFAMVAFGGAGPLHASEVAREIGMKTIIIPPAPGHFSAFGMLFSDLRYDYVRTWPTSLNDAAFDTIEPVYQDLEAQGRAAVAKAQVTAADVVVSRAADMRYVGQEHAVTVDLPIKLFRNHDRAGIKAEFDKTHELRYGTSAPQEQAEIVSLRASIAGIMTKPPLSSEKEGGAEPAQSAHTGKRPIYFTGHGFVETPSYARAALKPGNRIVGPAVVEEHASTTVLLPGDSLKVDGFGNLVITIGGK